MIAVCWECAQREAEHLSYLGGAPEATHCALCSQPETDETVAEYLAEYRRAAERWRDWPRPWNDA